jgi:hypothetical protein
MIQQFSVKAAAGIQFILFLGKKGLIGTWFVCFLSVKVMLDNLEKRESTLMICEKGQK